MKKYMAIAAGILFVLAAGYYKVNYVDVFEEKAVLDGQVSWSIDEGASVEPGSELVRISTLTGQVAAARAAEAGIVEEILVRPDDKVEAGMIVAVAGVQQPITGIINADIQASGTYTDPCRRRYRSLPVSSHRPQWRIWYC